MAHAPGQLMGNTTDRGRAPPVSEVRISQGTHRRKLPARPQGNRPPWAHTRRFAVRSRQRPDIASLRTQTTTVTAPALPTTAGLTATERTYNNTQSYGGNRGYSQPRSYNPPANQSYPSSPRTYSAPSRSYSAPSRSYSSAPSGSYGGGGGSRGGGGGGSGGSSRRRE